MMKRLFLFLLCATSALAYTASDGAKTITSDGTRADTQNAIDYVDGKNQDGWVITIGTSGASYTWTSAVAMASTFTHAVTIQSAGGAGNRTTITFNFTSSGGGLTLYCTDNKLTRLTGFNFAVTSGQTLETGAVTLANTGSSNARNSIRIDNCNFTECKPRAIGVLWPDFSGGSVYGVIDNCVFGCTNPMDGIYVYGGTTGNGWSGSTSWGTVDTVAIEDCTFTKTGDTVAGNPAIDSAYFGAKYMVRHCVFNNWVVVAHGADSAPTSTLQVEFMHNTVNLTGAAVDYIMYLRGGSMRMFDVQINSQVWMNQIVKTANDSSVSNVPTTGEHFQQVGHGASSGTEVMVPVRVWGVTLSTTQNNATLFGAVSGITLNTHYILSDPGDYVELTYPHPLRSGGAPAGLTVNTTNLTITTITFP